MVKSMFQTPTVEDYLYENPSLLKHLLFFLRLCTIFIYRDYKEMTYSILGKFLFNLLS